MFGPNKAKPKIGQSVSQTVPGSNRRIRVTRKDDTKEFQVFVAELENSQEEGPIGSRGKKDKKNNNDNNKRQRKRQGGSGGLHDIDRRTRPVDRLLD